ncbi:Rabenosyn-5, partial [Ascosphaera acerosa]
NLLAALQDPDRPPSPEQLAEAAKVRRRLVDAFAKLDAAARRIRDLPTDSPTQAKLQAAIHMQASNFLHLHMLPLKSLPRLLKHATPHGAADVSDGSPASSTSGGTPTTGARRVLALIRGGDGAGGASPDSIASGNSSAISALETEEKQLREQLAVLEEQRFLVSEMVADANRRRKFDEAASLAGNADDLRQEIERVSARIGELDFQSLYTSPLAQSQRQPNS